ncbi:MAG: hypothetical protein ACP5GJ_00975 [Nanopusillaceae archaeon]|jgi:hypothetical protein
MIKKIFLIFLIFLFFPAFSQQIYKEYCQIGGGTYFVNSSGQYCIVDGKIFNAIDYYNNFVPPQYSFCSHFNLTLVIKQENISNFTLYESYCEYPNGTLISPYIIFENYLNSNSNIIEIGQSNCSNILQCPSTPWEASQCSNIPYPCFNPPYIPPNLYIGSYNQTIEFYREYVGCGKCNSNAFSPWYLCPQNYSLEELYQEFEKQCPPPNKIEVNCYGMFQCIYLNQTQQNNTLVQQIIKNEENLTNNNMNNSNFIIPAIITISVMIIGLIILLFYLK